MCRHNWILSGAMYNSLTNPCLTFISKTPNNNLFYLTNVLNTVSKELQLQNNVLQTVIVLQDWGFVWHFSRRSAEWWHILYLQFSTLCLQSVVLNWQIARQNPFSCLSLTVFPWVVGAVIFDFFCLRARVALFHWVTGLATCTERLKRLSRCWTAKLILLSQH